MSRHLVRPAHSRSKDTVLETSDNGKVGKVEVYSNGEAVEAGIEDAEERAQRIAIRPVTPTKADIEAHYPNHITYRSWCPECVEGFGRERAHHGHDGEDRTIPLVSCDNMFFSEKGVFA